MVMAFRSLVRLFWGRIYVGEGRRVAMDIDVGEGSCGRSLSRNQGRERV